jgi:hypothetical protein
MALSNLTLPTAGASEDVWGGLVNAYLTALNQGKVDNTTLDNFQTSVSSSLSQRVLNSVFTQYQADQAVAIAALVPKTDYDTYRAQVSTSLQGKSAVGHTHSTDDIISGLLDPARIGLGAAGQVALRNSAGILVPIGVSTAVVNSSLVQRTSTGEVSVATPTVASSAATKAYVDSAVAAGGGGGGTATTDASLLTSGLLAAERIGLTTANTIAYRTGAATLGPIAFSATKGNNTLVQRDANGLFTINTPTATDNPTTKAYVDGADTQLRADMATVADNLGAGIAAKANTADVYTKAQVDTQVGTKVGVILVPAGTTTVPSGTPAGTLILERKA